MVFLIVALSVLLFLVAMTNDEIDYPDEFYKTEYRDEYRQKKNAYPPIWWYK